MAGWQIIILIALGAALVAAAVTGLGDRAPAARWATPLRRRLTRPPASATYSR
jgi:hypothetical protein